MGRRSAALVQTVRQSTLAQIELHLAAAFPASLLAQHATQAYSRERIFTLARTVWCWLWQVLQAHTSCREVVRQVQALFALQDAGAVDESTGAYCQARRKLPTALLQALLGARFQSAERAAAPAPRTPLLGGRTIRVIDGSGARLPDTPANRTTFRPGPICRPARAFPFCASRCSFPW